MKHRAALPLVLLALHACAPVDEADGPATAAGAIVGGGGAPNRSTYLIRRGPTARCPALMISADQALVAQCVNPDTRPADLTIDDGTAIVTASEFERDPASGLAVVRFPGMRNVTPGRVGYLPRAYYGPVTCTGYSSAGVRNAALFDLYTFAPTQNLLLQLRGRRGEGVGASDLGGPCDVPDILGRPFTAGLIYGAGTCGPAGCSVGGYMLVLDRYVGWIRNTARLQRLRATTFGFALVNPASGRCVSLAPWRNATIEPCDGSARQRFYAEPDETTPGTFRVVEGTSGSIVTPSWPDEIPLRVTSDNGSGAPGWTLPGATPGPARTSDPDACLDIPGSAAAPSGTELQLFSCNGGANQQWTSRWYLTRPAS